MRSRATTEKYSWLRELRGRLAFVGAPHPMTACTAFLTERTD